MSMRGSDWRSDGDCDRVVLCTWDGLQYSSMAHLSDPSANKCHIRAVSSLPTSSVKILGQFCMVDVREVRGFRPCFHEVSIAFILLIARCRTLRVEVTDYKIERSPASFR